MADTLVRVENVSKKFCRSLKKSLWYGVKDMAAEFMGRRDGRDGSPELRPDEFWAVRDVSFELQRGDCLGLIGRNGAGKSTLLKMLNGLIKPDTGRIEMHGRVGALIELGTGFNPILTGRENIYVNGAVLGLTRQEIDRKFDDIVDFAEIGEFIDAPVRSYSSGMKVRLGFAVAAQMEPDVLLIDEVLAVGDVGFRAKCYNEILKIMESAAVIFVSHSMSQVGKVCTRGMLLTNGMVRNTSSNISEIISAYYGTFSLQDVTTEGSGRAVLESVVFGTEHDEFIVQNPFSQMPSSPLNLDSHRPMYIELALSIDPHVSEYSILLSVFDITESLVVQTVSPLITRSRTDTSERVRVDLPRLPLNTGTYAMAVEVLASSSTDWGEKLVGVRSPIQFAIQRDKFIGSAPVILDGMKWTRRVGECALQRVELTPPALNASKLKEIQ